MLIADGVPICRVLRGGRLQAKDKDKDRSQVRGTRLVEFTLTEVAVALREHGRSDPGEDGDVDNSQNS